MPLATAWSRPGSYITATSACLAMNGPGSEPIATWIMSTSVLASMPFSLSSLMNSEVLVVGIRPVTTFWPLMSLMLSNLKSGAVAIHTAAPLTTLAMMSTGAPFEAAIAVHSGPWIENCALPEITADSATVGAPAVSLVRSRPCCGEEALVDRDIERQIQHRLERLRQRDLLVFGQRRRGQQGRDQRGGAGDTREQRHLTVSVGC